MTGLEVRNVQRWAQAVVWGVMACLLILATLLIIQAYRHVFRPAPFTFSQEIYLPTRGDICPGDVVEFRPRLIVDRVPTLLVVARTLWNVSEQRTLVPEVQPKFFIWTEEERGQGVSRAIRYQLPKTLPVGLYEVRGAATAFNSDASTYRVPFVIAASCFQKGNTP